MCAESVKKKSNKLAFIAISAILFTALVTISIMVTEDLFAKNGRYTGDTSQAAVVGNECLNPIYDSNTIEY